MNIEELMQELQEGLLSGKYTPDMPVIMQKERPFQLSDIL